MCALLRTEQHHVPERFLKPGFQSGVLDKINSVLFDATFLAKLNSEASAHLVQFACGSVFDTRTGVVTPGKRDMYISRACGYPFPHEALASLDTKFGSATAEVFDRIVQFEAAYPDGVPEYPAAVVDALKHLAEQSEFALLRNVHECFAHPDHGWVVTVWRCIKLLAACFWAAPIERFVNDEGSGANGKSFVVAIMEELVGSYTHQIKESMVTRPPPGPESPQPALLDLRGRPVVLAPEIEGSLRIQSAWVKRLCDPGVTWLGRELYGRKKFFNETRLGIQPIPMAVKKSTDALLAAEWVEAVEAYVTDHMEPTADFNKMASKSELLASLNADPKLRELRIPRRDLEEAVTQAFAFRVVRGRRDRVVRRADSAFLRFKSL
jgi:hypothetical protein